MKFVIKFLETYSETTKKKDNKVVEIQEDLVYVLLRIQEDNHFENPLSLNNIKVVLVVSWYAHYEIGKTRGVPH